MLVRATAVLAIVAFSILYSLKTSVTVWPTVLDSLPVARAWASVLLGASILVLVFFTTLRSRLEARGRWDLAAAATVGMAGAGIGGLVELRTLLVSVGLARQTREAIAAGYLGEITAAVALLWFFVTLHRRARQWLRGTGLAIAGSSLLVALTLVVCVVQLVGAGLDWLTAWSYLPAFALATVAGLAIGGPLRFLVLIARDPPTLLG